jgi:hypothetical protein
VDTNGRQRVVEERGKRPFQSLPPPPDRLALQPECTHVRPSPIEAPHALKVKPPAADQSLRCGADRGNEKIS